MRPERAPLTLMGLALAWLPLGAAPAALAQDKAPPAVDPSLAPYASTRDSARLPDGRWIHLVCMGKGSPTVILTTGANGWSVNWHAVQPAVAGKTRVCAWDRAGFGLSTGVTKPQTVDQSASDLQAALEAGRIAGPYVLVGASMGGWESLLLADREPSKVAGMVLLDPSFPDQNNRQRRVAPELMASDLAHPPPFIATLRACSAALRAGTVRPGGPDPDGCLRRPSRPSYPPELREALERVQADETPATIAARIDGLVSGPQLNDRNSEITVKPDRNYGAMPLVVLTADVHLGPDLPADLASQVPLVMAEWARAHEELAALSTRGVHRHVTDSPHDIASAKPQVVIDTIDQVVDEARAEGRPGAARR